MNYVIFEIPSYDILVTPWKVVGLVGALMFGSRWLVQAYHSRKAGKPVTPRLFWIMSIIGSLMTLAYFAFSPKRDMVGIVQNFVPCFVAAYNLYLELTLTKKAEASAMLAVSTNRKSGRVPAVSDKPAVAGDQA